MAETRRKPIEERKPDMLKNSEFAETKLQEVVDRDRAMGKVPLRIDSRTVIMVSPENCNENYAIKIKAKMKL